MEPARGDYRWPDSQNFRPPGPGVGFVASSGFYVGKGSIAEDALQPSNILGGISVSLLM